jgi:outer membrane protein OmpA-like peptidoglycan-associated protein
MTPITSRLALTSTLASTLLLSSSCALLHPEPMQTVPSRDAQAAVRPRLAQLSFGRQASFALCAEPACPHVTPKTLATDAPAVQLQPQLAALGDAPLASPVQVPSPSPAPVAETSLPAAVPPPSQLPLPSPAAPSSLPSDHSGPALPVPADGSSDAAAPQVVVTFEFDSSTLTPQAMASLVESLRHARSAQSIRISGRTDAVGDALVNDNLARARAIAVRDYLVRLAPELSASIAIHAKGACCFVAPNSDAFGRSKNRRVQIVFNPTRGA